MEIVITVPGASEQEISERVAAAWAVFLAADADPYLCSGAAIKCEAWDVFGFLKRHQPTRTEWAQASIWHEAIQAAMWADKPGWTKPEGDYQFELKDPRLGSGGDQADSLEALSGVWPIYH